MSRSYYKIACTAGLAMFAMFFGSGNLVFPLIVGMKSTDQYLIAGLGFILTGVLVPFLGLFSMVLYQGNKEKYFGLLGKYAPFILSLLMLSLLGPFGVVPRCILVAYGGISVVFPEIPLILFSIVFSLFIMLVIWQKNQVIPIIGKLLGPLKIGGIALIILAAIYQSPNLISSKQAEPALALGLMQGYQTMDLMAAFFFSITVIEYLRSIRESRQEIIKLSMLASIIGASLIALIYSGLVYLGAHYAEDLVSVRPEQYLAVIAHLTLGKYATLIVATTIFLSCLTTASSLLRLFAEFLKEDLSKNKISWRGSVWISIIISFALSLTGFAAIFSLLATILAYIYPALITLTIAAILHQYYSFKWSKQLFWLTLLGNGYYSIFM